MPPSPALPRIGLFVVLALAAGLAGGAATLRFDFGTGELGDLTGVEGEFGEISHFEPPFKSLCRWRT